MKGDMYMSKQLVDYLKRCDDAYYNSSNPIVSDATYDALVETLRRLDPTNEYLQTVGARVKSDKIGRLIPMGTLSKYHKDEEVQQWLINHPGNVLICPKYDGFAVELVYQDGCLVSASTRGDGNVGEDVLSAVMKIPSVPIHIESYPEGMLIVRGEAIIPLTYHDKIKALGYSAMRNAVPGIVRANRADALGYVDYVAYEFIDDLKDRLLQRARYNEDFNVEDYKEYNSTEIQAIRDRRDFLRANPYKYELDGVVLKTVKVIDDDLLHPEHMVAWKYESKLRETTLRDIEFNVGATGAISVVGIFDPVEFQGAKLTRASFGSLALYEDMAPAIGDIIEVSRRGDIIPWIEGITLRSTENTYQKLEYCPSCHTKLIDNKCTNQHCHARVKLKLHQYIQGAKIKGIGQALVNLLVDEGIIKSLVDIYDIDAEILKTLPRQGDSTVAKWKSLQEKRMTPLEFLCAYPIENAGASAWKSLLEHHSIRDIINMSEEDMIALKIKGLGTSKISSIVSQLEESKEEIMQLLYRLNL